VFYLIQVKFLILSVWKKISWSACFFHNPDKGLMGGMGIGRRARFGRQIMACLEKLLFDHMVQKIGIFEIDQEIIRNLRRHPHRFKEMVVNQFLEMRVSAPSAYSVPSAASSARIHLVCIILYIIVSITFHSFLGVYSFA